MKNVFTLLMALFALTVLQAQTPKVYYAFDGESLNSTVGNYPLTTVNGTAAFTTATHSGTSTHALTLDGSKYERTAFTYDTAASGLTISLWMKRQPNNFNGVLVSQLDVAQAGGGMTNYYGTFNTYISPDGHLAMEIYTSTGSSSTIYSVDTIGYDWTMASFTWDHNMKYIYVNGHATDSTGGPPEMNKANAEVDLRIGAIKYYPLGGQPSFQSAYIGDIDEVRFYGEALTEEQIANLYNTGTISSVGNVKSTIVAGIYPNPANNTLYLRASETITGAKVYNVMGEEMINVTGNMHSLDIADLSVGVYTLHINTDKGAAIKKFVKQ